MKKHVSELEALYRISRILASGTLQRQVLTEVLDVLDYELGMRRGTIMAIFYSVKLRIMGKANISLRRVPTTFSGGERIGFDKLLFTASTGSGSGLLFFRQKGCHRSQGLLFELLRY